MRRFRYGEFHAIEDQRNAEDKARVEVPFRRQLQVLDSIIPAARDPLGPNLLRRFQCRNWALLVARLGQRVADQNEVGAETIDVVEARRSKGPQGHLHWGEHCRRRGAVHLEEPGQSRMLKAKTTQHREAMVDLIAPVRFPPIELSRTNHALSDSEQEGVLAAEVIVEGHRRHTDGIGQSPHGECIGARPIDQRKTRRDQSGSRQRAPRSAGRSGFPWAADG
jgi:hypothetical protein